MQRASTLFTSEQRQQIDRAVAQAESGTSCEIVPVVATASGRYDRAEDIVGLWLAVISALVLSAFYPPKLPEPGSWGLESTFWLPLVVLAVVMVVMFFVGAIVADQIGWLRRLFTPRVQMHEEVSARARQVFFDNRIHRTGGDTGVLIYVSLYEHLATVLASEAILDKLGKPAVEQLCQQLTAGLHRGQPTEALCGVITEAGKLLAGPWPRAANDVNELPDALVVID